MKYIPKKIEKNGNYTGDGRKFIKRRTLLKGKNSMF